MYVTSRIPRNEVVALRGTNPNSSKTQFATESYCLNSAMAFANEVSYFFGERKVKTEFSTIKGDVRITEEIAMHGTVTGSITVAQGGHLYFYGTCKGNVIAEMGGEFFLFGKVEGDVQNRGGYIEISGEVQGNLSKSAGHTVLHDKAKVK